MKRDRMAAWRQGLTQWRGATPKSKALMQLVARDIEAGQLREGERLPSQREVSLATGLSLQTVTNAYKDLERHGLIRCDVGRGSFVSRRVSETVAAYIVDRNDQTLVDLSTARIAHTLDHQLAWQDLCKALGAEFDQPWLRDNRPIAGFEPHRQIALSWLADLGVTSQLDRVFMTNGGAHGVFVALAAVASAEDVVLTERLTDHGVIGAANVLGLDLRGVDMDDHGLQPDHFEELCAHERVSALVLTPNGNNPTMAVLPQTRRRAIARIAQQYGVYVIEDDVYGPLMQPRAAPIAHWAPDYCFYVSGFSKSVMTGLRVGVLSAPRRMATRVDSLLRVSTWMAAPLMAEIAMRWVADGTAQRLIALQRSVLARRHAMLLAHLGRFVLGHHPQGLLAWLRVPPAWPLDDLAACLRQRDVAVTTPEPFMVKAAQRPQALRICLGADCSDEQLEAGLKVLAQTLAERG